MRWTSLVELLPPVLDGVVEGAWIGVLYLVVELAFGRHELAIGVVQLAVAAIAGFGLGRLLRATGRPERPPFDRRSGEAAGGTSRAVNRLPVAMRVLRSREIQATVAGLAFVLTGGVVGWIWSPGVRSAMGGLDLPTALARHPGGWLVGLAVLRGLGAGQAQDEEGRAGSGLRLGIPVLVVLWLLGRSIGEPDRSFFRDQALMDTLLFMVAGLLALGVAGMRTFARTSSGAEDVDWRTNLHWFAMLFGLVVVMVLLAVPVVSSVGRPVVELVLALLWIAFEIVALIVTLRALPRALAIAVPALAGGLALAFLLRLTGIHAQDIANLATQVENALRRPAGADQGPPASGTIALFGLALALLAVGTVAALVWLWLRRRPAARSGELFEERSTLVEPFSVRWPRLPARPARLRHADPTDAVSAYRAALAELDTRSDLRRMVGESPAEHSRRLSGWSEGGPAMARLAADYQLARFGGVRITLAEDSRALGRWRQLRDLVRGRPRHAG